MIDLTFDCREDARGRDPDSNSPTLRRYHQIFWSKPLPNGQVFQLDISGPKPFLVHRSDLGEYHLTSDSITHRYASRAKLKPFVERLPEPHQAFAQFGGWLIPECILFPGKRVNRQNTINGARGMNRRIGDRFDLTLECIRRHYLGESSPLTYVLGRYSAFFSLFGNFEGYVEFFLLQDLVTSDFRDINFYLPFDAFKDDPLPQDFESYVSYLGNVEKFAINRAERMQRWCYEQSIPVQRGPNGVLRSSS